MKHVLDQKKASFVLLLGLSALYAGDYASLNFIGFSEYGDYLAFEQYGCYDGSGFPYSEIFFVDVAGNDFIWAPISEVVDDEIESETSVQELAMVRSRSKLQELGIIQGNVGEHIIAHPTTEPDVDPHFVRFGETVEPLNEDADPAKFELLLTETEVETPADHDLDCGSARILELLLINTETGQEQMLQQDTKLPERRGYVYAYRIEDVYLYYYAHHRFIAVFINCYTPGFEGPDMRYMVVTGQLDL